MTKLYCIACPNGCLMTVIGQGVAMVVEGNKCQQGFDFAKAELAHPARVLTTTVRTVFPEVPVISVRTDGEIPKTSISKAMHEIAKVVLDRELSIGDVVIEDLADTEVNLIITSPALMQRGAELENKNDKISKMSPADTSDQSASGDVHSTAGADAGDASGVDGYDFGEGYVPGVEGVLDELGEDPVGGVVGAAGESVGVEDGAAGDGSSGSGGRNAKGKYSRPHIKR